MSCEPLSKLARRNLSFLLLAFAPVLAGCGGEADRMGIGTDTTRLEFVDGPADHVGGGVIPSFRVWAIDAFGRRATGLPPGTMTLELIAPDGSVQDPNFATVQVSFGQAVVTPTQSLPIGSGYSVRATFDGRSDSSPPFAVVVAPDVVRIENPSSGEMGLLVDGTNNIGLLPDSAHVSSSAIVPVGVLNSNGAEQAVAVFAPDRRPELVPFAWTAGVDTLTITLNPRVTLDVTVWVVGGDFAAEQPRIASGLALVEETWRRERFGVTLGDVRYVDQTALEPTNGTFAVGPGGAPFGAIGDAVGRDAGRYNIYVTSDVIVAGMSTTAFSEQPGSAMAVHVDSLSAGASRVLAHEFGHNLGLIDTPDVEGFQLDGNLMIAGTTSMVLTEGQTFRAHFASTSLLRFVREGDTFGAVSCENVEPNRDCPWLALRIWAEVNGAPNIGPARRNPGD